MILYKDDPNGDADAKLKLGLVYTLTKSVLPTKLRQERITTKYIIATDHLDHSILDPLN
jgi:hypothetical protein